MAFISATALLFIISLSLSSSPISAASVVQDLNNLHPPPDFKTTISNNCKNNPLLRYCNSYVSPSDLQLIFKFTIVASHLCNVSNNPNCKEDFPKIDLGNRPKIAPLYLSFDFFWKYCPLTVISIDLANNSLKGSFPYDVFNCAQIQELDLSFNGFSGEFPVQNFSIFTNLSFLNLSYNRFSESEIHHNEFFKRFNLSSFLHSGLIPNHNKIKIKAYILFIGLPVLVILTVIYICLPKFTQQKDKFTPSIIKKSTNGFSKENLVATSEGVHIYKGLMRDGSEVRIEVYNCDLSRQERENFVTECQILVQLNHKNLVRLLGWCDDRKLRAVDGENLERWLVTRAPPWAKRVKILVKILEGMCYLEEEWPEVGYYLESSNLLLADSREPLISRFKVGDRTYIEKSKHAKQVYKFGVLVLEMVANRRPKEEFEGGESAFIEWMRIYFSQKMLNLIVDEKIYTTEKEKSFERAIQLGFRCTVENLAELRPSFDHINKTMISIYNSVNHHYEFHGGH